MERTVIGVMDRPRSGGRGEVLDPVHEGVDENLILSVEGVATDAVNGSSMDDRTSLSGEVGTSEEMGKDSGSNKQLKEGPEEVKGQDLRDQQIGRDALPGVDQGTSYNPKNMVHEEVLETVLVIDSIQTDCVNGDNRKLEAKVNESVLGFAIWLLGNHQIQQLLALLVLIVILVQIWFSLVVRVKMS